MDCFAGTSTVGQFALSNKRKFIGYDMNPQFIMASEIRLRDLENYNRTLEYWQEGSQKFTLKPDYLSKKVDWLSELFPDKIEPVSPELKKSFKDFSKVYNNCFRTVQRI